MTTVKSMTGKRSKKAPPAKKPAKKKPGENAPQSFFKRLLFGEEKPDLSELNAGSTTILDILSPTVIDTKSRDYIIVDGVYHAYLYVTGYGYSTTVGSCWLAPLVEAGEGISLIYLFRRQPREKILSKISQTTMMNRSRMRDIGDNRQDYEELDSAIASGLYLKDAMNRQGEDFYYMYTLIEAVANDPETLEQRVTAVEKLCVSVDMIARRCDYKQEQAFLSALPLLSLDTDIERKARRNALTSGVAAAFPFASYELSDRNGIFLGLNMYNRSPVFLDFYDDYKYTNGNCWIGGSSGAGKTFTLNCLGGRLRQQGKRIIFIVPKKGHEFRPLCELMGGLYLRLSPSSKDCPNIMAILAAWSDEPGNLTRCPMNTELLRRVRQSQELVNISRYLGRFREIFAQGKKNGYAYGRGEKYSLELGNDLSKALTSELAMLATPETTPLFLQKYRTRQIKQYRRREPVFKGMGDIICCLDESASTIGESAAWGKAVAMTLLEIAASSKRRFALIHFAGSGSFQTDVFVPGKHSAEDKIRAAETFLNGGTDYETPLRQALALMKSDGFENADVVFLTDGECALSEQFLTELHTEQAARRFTVTGILMDKGKDCFDFSLQPFCQKIYRTSELTEDDVVRAVVSERV